MRFSKRFIPFKEPSTLESMKDSFLGFHALALRIVHDLPSVETAMDVCGQPAGNVAYGTSGFDEYFDQRLLIFGVAGEDVHLSDDALMGANGRHRNSPLNEMLGRIRSRTRPSVDASKCVSLSRVLQLFCERSFLWRKRLGLPDASPGPYRRRQDITEKAAPRLAFGARC